MSTETALKSQLSKLSTKQTTVWNFKEKALNRRENLEFIQVPMPKGLTTIKSRQLTLIRAGTINSFGKFSRNKPE